MAPELSVLIPLEDPRGDGAEHLRTWGSEQSLDRGRYQLVLASAGDHPSAEERAQAELAPHDVLERRPGASLIELWNIAAARADSDWLILTENHCEADPACLAVVAEAIAERGDDHDAFTLEHGHITATATGDLNARWFDEVYEDWAQPGQWARLNLVGFAIRRDAYERAGGLEPDYGLFSAPLLSARLDDLGARIDHLPEARVLHVHPDEIREHHDHSADFAWGECEARSREPQGFFERYFGPDGQADRLEPRRARQTARVLASAGGHAVAARRRDVPWLARELATRLPALLGAARMLELRERVDFTLSEYTAAKLPAPPDVRWRAFLRAQERILKLTRLRWLRERGSPSPGLTGVHDLEHNDQGSFRWTEPVATIQVRTPGELRLDTGGLRGVPHEHVSAAYLDGRRLAPGSVRSEGSTLVVELPAGGPQATLTLVSRPFEPRRHGSDDPRRLGLPVFAVSLPEA